MDLAVEFKALLAFDIDLDHTAPDFPQQWLASLEAQRRYIESYLRVFPRLSPPTQYANANAGGVRALREKHREVLAQAWDSRFQHPPGLEEPQQQLAYALWQIEYRWRDLGWT